MTARTYAVALIGIDARLVEVEADIGTGLPGMTIVGLPDAAVQQARDRVRAALINSGCEWPKTKVTVGLSPADLPKRGSTFDLALAVALLAAAGVVPPDVVREVVLYGELSLDGRIRGVRGVLPATLGATAAGIPRVVVPRHNAPEARLVPGIDVLPVGSLRELVCILRGEPLPEGLPESAEPASLPESPPSALDLSDVLGQAKARRALEVAAAGGHHLYLHGPPGTGKTMLAERLPGLLPPLEGSAALEVTAIHSVAGVLPPGGGLVTTPPYQDVHHTSTVVALVGGGSGLPRPGAVSLAHRGVLFLDEAPEFSRAVLEALRQPLESGVIHIARAGGQARYPARFQLVLAANPCPCATVTGRTQDCTCSRATKARYTRRLSGALLDRIDLRVHVARLNRAEMLADRSHVESTAVVAERVRVARDRAAARLRGTPWRTNSDVPTAVLRRRWPLPGDVLAPLEESLRRGVLSTRALDRTIRVAWTIADLAGRDQPTASDVGQVVYLRAVA